LSNNWGLHIQIHQTIFVCLFSCLSACLSICVCIFPRHIRWWRQIENAHSLHIANWVIIECYVSVYQMIFVCLFFNKIHQMTFVCLLFCLSACLFICVCIFSRHIRWWRQIENVHSHTLYIVNCVITECYIFEHIRWYFLSVCLCVFLFVCLSVCVCLCLSVSVWLYVRWWRQY